MIPKSLSASSILVSEACMARWKTENFDRTPQFSSEPANIGTSVHYALEHFVRDVYLEKKYAWQDIKHLNAYYQLGYIETFNSTNFDTDAFKDGAALVAKWYDRNKEGLANQVLSCEVKENFTIKTSAGPIPVNFIWDRADRISADEYAVIDYKTLRAPVNPQDLKQKIQPRLYALAAQIKWPDANRIWVSFDMLRYDEVGVVFTRDENAATYRYVQRAAERIIAIAEDEVEETLNPECKWCIRKTECDTLQRANAGGNPMGMPIEEVVKRAHQIDNQLIALKYAQEQLDKLIAGHLEAEDIFEDVIGDYEVKMGSSPRRAVSDASSIASIVGPELSKKYGNFTVTSVDQMIKDGVLSSDQEAQVRAYVKTNWSSPRPKIKKKESF